MKRNWLLSLLCVACFADAKSSSGSEPNNRWEEATPVGAGLVVTARLELINMSPDTLLGLVDAEGMLVESDDDGSFFGNGLASALVATSLPVGDELHLQVTGAYDFDFDGLTDSDRSPHPQQGPYDAYATIYNQAGSVVFSQEYASLIGPGEVIDYRIPLAPGWRGGSFDFELNNLSGEASDVDFWVYDSLPAGKPYLAEITSAEFDSVLGLYDSRGAMLQLDDDSGFGILSLIAGTVPADGTLYFAVSAYPDSRFAGSHSSDGVYTLRLMILPEPSSILLVGMIALSQLPVFRRSPQMACTGR